MFKVHYSKVEVEPLEQDHIIEDDRKHYIEAGKVIQVGSDVHTIKVGDILYFQDYACIQTAKDPEGVSHWVVSIEPEVILGKYEQQ